MKLVDISLYIYIHCIGIYIYYVSFHLFQHQVPTCGRGMLWLTPKAISNLRRNSNPSCPRLSSRETCNAKNSSRSRHILSPVSESIKVSPQHLLSPVMRTMQDNASCHRNKWVDSILSLRTSKLCATGSDMFFPLLQGLSQVPNVPIHALGVGLVTQSLGRLHRFVPVWRVAILNWI